MSADPHITSLLDRFKAASKDTFWRRLLLWTVIVTAASVDVRLMMPQGINVPSSALLAAVLALGGCAGLGACIYCFARFVLFREVRYMLAAAAFSALAGGSALQAAADFRTPAPAVHGWIMTCAWLISAVLFAGAAYSHSVLQRSSKFDTIEQFVLAAIAVSVFPLVASPYALDPNVLCALSGSLHGALVGYVLDSAAGTVALVLMVIALLGYYRRSVYEDDRMVSLICYFLVPCSFGLLFRAASSARFDEWGCAAEALMAVAWIVLVIGVGVETALSHKEASERLAELEALHDVSWSLVGAGTVRDLLNLFVTTIVEKAEARIAAVYLADEPTQSLEVSAICGVDNAQEIVGTRYPLISSRSPGFHTGHTAEAFRSREVQIALDVFVDVEFVPWRVIAVDEGGAASLPLVDKRRAVGVLNVYFSDHTQLSPQRLKLLATIAAAATPAIQHARAGEADRDSAPADRSLKAA